jgi:hypothetical protein
MEQANSKNKTLRAAALEALAEHDRPEVAKLFGDLIKGNALELLARPLRTIRNLPVLNLLLEEGKRVFELLLKGESEQIPRFEEILNCVEQRKDAEVEQFLLDCFNNSSKLTKLKAAKASPFSGADVIHRLAVHLSFLGTPKALDAILARRDQLPPAAIPVVLTSAFHAWPPDKVYQEFSPFLTQKSGAGKEAGQVLARYLIIFSGNAGSAEFHADISGGESTKFKVTLDPRWIEACIKADLPSVVCHLAHPDSKSAISYLVKILEAAPKTTGAALARTHGYSSQIIQTLARCQYPAVTDLFLRVVGERTKKAQQLDYDLQMLFHSACHLPAADLPKLDAFAARLDEKFVDYFLESLGPLRPINQPNQS